MPDKGDNKLRLLLNNRISLREHCDKLPKTVCEIVYRFRHKISNRFFFFLNHTISLLQYYCNNIKTNISILFDNLL